MKYLANENFPIDSVVILRNNGIDINSIYETNRGITDIAVMEFAKSENRIIITFDKDYGELIYQRKIPFKEGVIFLRFIPSNSEEPAYFFMDILNNMDINFSGKFTVIDKEKIRQRNL